jgi:hypothetical protein
MEQNYLSLLHTHTSVVEEEFSSQGKWFFRVISMPWTLERVALRNTPTVAAENGPMFILPRSINSIKICRRYLIERVRRTEDAQHRTTLTRFRVRIVFFV